MAENWIDVSSHNGAINWTKVKESGITGAVIRAGYGKDASQQDAQFTANMQGALAAGMKTAVYWFSYADSVDDAQKEWAACKQVIEPYRGKICFVASDFEYDSVRYYTKLHGAAPANELVNDMVNAFLNAAKVDGWGTALYTNNDYRRNVFSSSTLAAWDIWLADYTGEPDIPCAIQQTGSNGTVAGISGNVDMDTCFKAYGAVTVPEPAKPTPAPAKPSAPSGNANTRAAQQFYNTHSAGLTIDGIYGPATRRAAIQCVQRGCNQAYGSFLAIDGVYGPKTDAAVLTLRRGDNNSAVYSLQAALMAHGYSVGGIDGVYGPNTESAVRAFQRDNGLTVDGLAGKKTFAKLCE